MINRPALLFGSLALLAAVAHAGDTFYTNRASWQGLVNVTGTDTFEGIAGAGSYANQGPSFTGSVATYSVTDGQVTIIDSGFYPAYNFGSGANLSAQYYTGSSIDLLITFAAPTKAAGLDLGTFTGVSAKATLSDGSSDVVPTGTAPTAGFVGFISDSAVSSITIHTDGSFVQPYYFPIIDNVSVASVPEPSAFGFLACAGLPLLIKRKRIG